MPRDLPEFRIDFTNAPFVDLTGQADYEFPHPIQRWVMPVMIMGMRDGAVTDATAVGTCFWLAPGIAATAKHVLEDHFQLDVLGSAGTETGVAVIYLTDDWPGHQGAYGGPLFVNKVVSNPEHDLALLVITMPVDDGNLPSFPRTRLTVDPPPPGTLVMTLGYTEMTASVQEPNFVELEQKVRASTGKIQSVDVWGRGEHSALLTFPTITGDYPAPGGMSGGPVITNDGRVCGVVCRSLGPSLDDDLWTSTASLLAYIFTMDLDASVDGVLRTYSMLELAELGVVPTDGSHRKLEVHKRGDKMDVRWRRDAS